MKKILFLLLLSVAMYGQVPADATPLENIQITNNAQDNVSTKVAIQTNDGVINWKYIADIDVKTKARLSTGLLKNGLISANGDPTKFNITAGIGIISNFDDPENPTSTIVNFPAFTGITPTYLLTGTITYVAINSTPAVVMQATPFTPEQRRSLIVLGAVIHSNLTTINVLNNISAPTNAGTNQLHDFIEAVGALNITGNKYTANGANLQLNKSAGLIFKLGSNFANDWKNPHELAQTAGTSLTFRYRTQNGTEGSDRINLDPALYDNNNVLTAVPNNKFTIQTVTMFQSGLTRIQYGQNVYDDLATAKNAVFIRNFVLEPNSKENGIIRAYIIMKNTTTSLQNVSDADILEAQKFGGVASGGVALTLANIVTALGYTPENLANKQNSLVVDGTGTKYPTVDAINNEVILKDSTPQTKVGGFTSGGITNSYPSDNWIAMGTSVTFGGAYTAPMALQLNVILTNLGVSGSDSGDLVNHYASIPTLNSGNENTYRLISIEHGINDASHSIPLSTFRTNLVNAILHIKGKGWANNKILIINGNYCTTPLQLSLQESYANEAILIAKEQGVQYSDIYNYTKVNGGDSLLGDQIHPTVAGGKVYARGVIASMQGGGEFTNSLSVVNGITANGSLIAEKSITTLGSIKTGLGNNNNPTNTVNGDVIIPAQSALTSQNTQNGIIGRISPLEDFGSGENSMTLRNYTEFGRIKAYVAGTVRGSQNLALEIKYDGIIQTPFGINSAENINIGSNKNFQFVTGAWTNKLNMSDGAGSTVFTNGNSAGNFDFNVANGENNSINLAFRVSSNKSARFYNSLTVDENLNMAFNKNIQFSGAYTNKIIPSDAAGSVVLTSGFSTGTIDFNVSNGVTNASNLALRINNNRSLTVSVSPTTSAGTYDFLTRNTSNGVIEKVTSASVAPIASPTFTGNPTAPTPTLGDNDTSVATTAFVQSTTNSNAVLLTGSQTITGRKTLTSDNTTAGGIAINNSKTTSSTFGDSAGMYINNTGTAGILIETTDNNGITSKSFGNGNSIFAESWGTGTALTLRNQGGTGDLLSAELGATRITSAGVLISNKFKSNGTIELKSYTVATLPTGVQGATAYVTDATAPTYLGALTGGGSVVCPVFYNGTAWVSH